MNIKTSTFFIILITFFVSIEGLAQSAGDYRSATSGEWSQISTWETYNGSNWDPAITTPDFNDGIITISDSVAISADVSIDETTILNQGVLNINSGITLTLNDGSGTDLIVNSGGKVNNNFEIFFDEFSGTPTMEINGTLDHQRNGGTIPTSTWGSNSTCIVSGTTSNAPSNLDQTFGNFIWNTPDFNVTSTGIVLGLTSLSVFNGDFTIQSTGSSGDIIALSSSTVTISCNGNFSVTDSSKFAITTSGTVTLDVGGDFTYSSSGNSDFTFSTSGTASLNVEGDFQGNASLDIGDNTVVFDGSGTAQNITGTTTFYDITANNDINVEGTVSLSNYLTIGENVTFDADGTSDGGTFTLLSTSESRAASIFEIPSTSNVTGNVTVQRFINESNEYTYMAFPVNGLTVADLQNSFPITGPFTGSSGGSSPSFYYYDESVLGNLDEGWTNYPTTDNSAAISSTRGYASYMQGGSNTISVRGPINKGNVSAIDLGTTFNSSGNADDDGWNLVANPFPCPIDWNSSGWTKTNIGLEAYIWNGSGHQTTGVDWDGIIAPGQAFWVKAAGTPTLSVTEEVKVNPNEASFYRVSKIREDMLLISLENEKNTDKAAIYFKDEATNDFDNAFDAWKLSNSYFNISSYVRDDQFLAANNVPLSECEKSIGLKIDNIKKGDYKLNFSNLEYFTFDANFKLVDHYLNTEVEIYDESVYDFSVNDDNGSYGKDRFELLVQPTSLTTPEITFEENILQSSAEDNNQWYRNGNVLEAATDQTLEVNETGVYHLVSSPFGCDMMAKDLIAYISDKDNEINSCESKLDLITNNIDQGSYSLKIVNLDLSDSLKTIKLVDRYRDEKIEINEDFNYSFSVDDNVSSYEDRFEIETVVSINPEISLEDKNLLVSNFDNSNQWFKGGKIIENATEKTYRATETGEYYVEVNKNGCVGKSNRVDVTVKITSLEDLIEDIKIYPNPSRDYLTIELPEKLNEEKIAIDFYDLTGRHCISKKLTSSNNKEIEIDISDLKKGIYNLSINGNNFSSNHKILKY